MYVKFILERKNPHISHNVWLTMACTTPGSQHSEPGVVLGSNKARGLYQTFLRSAVNREAVVLFEMLLEEVVLF